VPGRRGRARAAWRRAAAAAALASAASAGAALAVPADEAIVPLDQYTTAKARALATTYRRDLLELHRHLDHCVPWVEVPKGGLGFRSPKGTAGDERYLTLWIWIEQGDDPAFAATTPEQRASAMFSRYGIPLLRRLAGIGGVGADAKVDGFGVILSWIRPRPVRPAVNETLVAFVDRTTAVDVAARRRAPDEALRQARLSLFDGTTELIRPQLEIWEDPFLGTFKPKDHVPPAGAPC
jgi:hypothetical protein